jgi:16S rRNA (cytidine1402-2'-O)-methyltransferase
MLYFVPVPVGNLEDITLRAHRLLQTAPIIISEDSRETRKLMKLLEIDTRPKFVDFTREHKLNIKPILVVFEQMKAAQDAGEEMDVLVVSDSGTPGISDPGVELVRAAREMGIAQTVLPGATALIPAVVMSGITGKEFLFLGFLPIKKGRQTAFKELATSQYPVVFYESVHRIEKCVEEIKVAIESDRKISICREISKKFEDVWVGTVGELEIATITQKGEFVIVLDKV